MSREIYFAAPWWAGIRHRFMTLNHVRTFANYWAYRAHFLWGVSGGVSYCRFEELLAPVPGVRIINLSEHEIVEVERDYRRSDKVQFRGHSVPVYRAGTVLRDKMLAFDLSWDLSATNTLQKLVPSKFHPPTPAAAAPAAEIRTKAAAYIRRHDMTRRVGIRVRVTESMVDGRKPRRIQRELNDTVKAIIRMPWHVPVFVVTDSEYIQRMLASHFHDTRFLPKRFTSKEVGGGYVDRHDAAAMRTFLTELVCLSACRKILNIGGFVNEESIWEKMIWPPYDGAVVPVRASQK